MERITNVEKVLGAQVPSRLVIFTGTEAGLEVTIAPQGLVLGADDTCAVVVRDARVSRKHVSIVPGVNGFHVKDLGSRNGTWIDDVRITEANVPAGTLLRIGSTLIQLMPAEQAWPLDPSERNHFGELRGESEAMRRIFTVLERMSASDSPVLLLGESGTGKELAARALHGEGPRGGHPFVVFDCGAASESLIESELFGHVRGAFTGAVTHREGAFAAAHGGTLFLDEIGDLPLALQPKLLRMLERSEVVPVGSNQAKRYDVRVVAATHRDLRHEATRGTFRSDLYYRLAVVEIELPSLRQRRSDIPLLVRTMLAVHGKSFDDLEGPALERLCSYAWPGNVRELRNVVARAVALAPPGTGFQELPFLLSSRDSAAGAEPSFGDLTGNYHEAKQSLLNRFDRAYTEQLLARSQGNLSRSARMAGLDRKHLYRILERAGVTNVDSEKAE